VFTSAKGQWEALSTSVRIQGQLLLHFTQDRVFVLSVCVVV
jgi:hypothetical protein